MVTGVTADPVRVGIVLREQDLGAWSGRFEELAAHAVDAGIDHLTVGDHVSFADGHGADGLIQATALLSAHPRLSVQTGVYLIALRHPAVVARQLATIALLAPGRFTFGVGVGGDDPSELELCGINPRERGARTTEALLCVRLFMRGEDVEFRGRFFDLRGAIRPAPSVPIPILVGGRSDAALVRTGQLGDGWLALWVSPRRFAEAVDRIDAVAARAADGASVRLASTRFSSGPASAPRARRRGSGSAVSWKRRTRFRSTGSSGMCPVVRPRRWPRRSRRTSRWAAAGSTSSPRRRASRTRWRP